MTHWYGAEVELHGSFFAFLHGDAIENVVGLLQV
jgi:hypothetical protein